MTKALIAVTLTLLLVIACGSGSATPHGAGTRTQPSPAAATPTPAGTAGGLAPTAGAAPTRSTATATLTPTPPASSATPTAGLPGFSHIYVIVMENKEYDQIVGSPDAPYINDLISRYGLATRYFAVAHPSLPNYLALVSGSTQGVTDDKRHDIDAPNLADQIEASGSTWKAFVENVPAGCETGSSASGGPDGEGAYVRKHNPFISFTSISGDPARCANITGFARFDPAAADFELIVPNMTNDMHDGSVADGDAFLRGFVPRILDSPAFQQGGVLFITWDEGTSKTGGGGQVATLVISTRTPAGFTSDSEYTHYSLVRTIEDAWGLDCLANACDANDMRAFFP